VENIQSGNGKKTDLLRERKPAVLVSILERAGIPGEFSKDCHHSGYQKRKLFIYCGSWRSMRIYRKLLFNFAVDEKSVSVEDKRFRFWREYGTNNFWINLQNKFIL
jgi:hypothetical protein